MLRVMVLGLGPIGLSCARAILAEREFKLVAMVDTDPQKHGQTVADLMEHNEPALEGRGPRVTGEIDAAVAEDAHVALVCTSSSFDVLAPTLESLIKHNVSVVSSCEEMLWPWYRHEALAHEIDSRAKASGCVVLGTGVNPGFVMDALPVMLCSMVRRVKGVRCTRKVNATLRRRPLQAKIGATLSVKEFEARKAADAIGHRGIEESVALLAAGLGHEVAPGSVKVTLEPELADEPIDSALGLIQPGRVAGIHNVASWEDDGFSIELDLTMKVGLDDPRDTVEVRGPVQLTVEIPGGLPGDSCTVAALLNHVRLVHASQTPGLRTMLDMPPAGCQLRPVARAVK